MKRYSLIPFGDPVPDLKLEVAIARRSNRLALNYALTGDLARVMIPPAAPTPSRRDGLWQATCFEFFVALKDSPQYWEFNLSPSGDWNIYHLDDYRQGMQAEARFDALPFVVHRRPDSLSLDLEISLDSIIPMDAPIQVAITAVIQRIDGTFGYWALAHCGPRPDFHQRKSFIVVV